MQLLDTDVLIDLLPTPDVLLTHHRQARFTWGSQSFDGDSATWREYVVSLREVGAGDIRR